MIIQIDISGQIQQKNLNSALGFRRSDGLAKSILLKKGVKKKINQKYKGQVINLIEKIHCILIYYCIRDYLDNVSKIKICRDIDKRVATNLLKKIFRGNNNFKKIKLEFISGKNEKSNGHSVALKTYRHGRYASKIITLKMIEDVLFSFR